jgi:hypothetical protein
VCAEWWQRTRAKTRNLTPGNALSTGAHGQSTDVHVSTFFDFAQFLATTTTPCLPPQPSSCTPLAPTCLRTPALNKLCPRDCTHRARVPSAAPRPRRACRVGQRRSTLAFACVPTRCARPPHACPPARAPPASPPRICAVRTHSRLSIHAARLRSCRPPASLPLRAPTVKPTPQPPIRAPCVACIPPAPHPHPCPWPPPSCPSRCARASTAACTPCATRLHPGWTTHAHRAGLRRRPPAFDPCRVLTVAPAIQPRSLHPGCCPHASATPSAPRPSSPGLNRQGLVPPDAPVLGAAPSASQLLCPRSSQTTRAPCAGLRPRLPVSARAALPPSGLHLNHPIRIPAVMPAPRPDRTFCCRAHAPAKPRPQPPATNPHRVRTVVPAPRPPHVQSA